MLCHKLSQLKEQRGLTNQQIADISGVPLSTVTRVFNGQTDNPNYRTVADIVIAMHGSLDAIEGIVHTQEKTPDKVVEIYEQTIKNKDKWLKVMFIALMIMLGVMATITLIDALNGNIGFIRY